MRTRKGHRPISLKPLLLAMAASGMLIAEQGLANSYQVTNLADSGPGSLRQILTTANGIAGPHTITFQSGLSGSLTLTTGQLVIQQPMTITGPGATLLTISGDGVDVPGPPSGPSRVFYIADGLDDTGEEGVTIEGLRITAGNGKDVATSSAGPGGCILSDSKLILVDSIVSGCSANDSGGGIRVTSNAGGTSLGPFGSMSLGLYRSTITDNAVNCTGVDLCAGGGVSVGLTSGPGSGGIYSKYSRISDNALVVGEGPFATSIAQAGGGLASTFSLLLGSTITGNRLSGNPTTTDSNTGDLARMGGGVFSIVTYAVDSTIDNNVITASTGTIAGQQYIAGGGMATSIGAIIQSTVSGNSVPAGFHGGGVAFKYDDTFSGSSGKYVEIVSNSTITSNSGASGLAFVGKYGQPMTTPAADRLVINSTIVANTLGGGVDLYCEATDCPISGADNLVESLTNADLANPPLTSDPQLSPLGDNGGFSTGAPGDAATGPVRTHALGAQSPAFNQGNIDFGSGIDEDQRGGLSDPVVYKRVQGGRADIGAYEYTPPVSIPTLSPFGIGLLSGLLALFGWRRRPH